MSTFKPERMKWNEIREKAEDFRIKYISPPDMIPVPIEDIVEFKLGITLWPIDGLKQKIDIDGFLSNDLKYLFVDSGIYMDKRWENRLRFTFAHEIGHLILHNDVIQKSEFRTETEWINFREEMSEDDLYWFEQQAYEFAGRLLVPKTKLVEELEKNREKINQFHMLTEKNNDELLFQAISRVICDKFGVSDGVIFRRIRNEKIWNEFDF